MLCYLSEVSGTDGEATEGAGGVEELLGEGGGPVAFDKIPGPADLPKKTAREDLGLLYGPGAPGRGSLLPL